jgi:hypothetical protein
MTRIKKGTPVRGLARLARLAVSVAGRIARPKLRLTWIKSGTYNDFSGLNFKIHRSQGAFNVATTQ